ncbi:hypothetical protein PF049_02640 [Erythrobacteraceae bacterium WH01K]|nr:hypothetical protein PF049_02640 [Erythrobacteraceae bacterium WH01K]
MAEIPIEKKSGFPWWLLLLLAGLLVGGLIWWLAEKDDNELVENDVVAEDQVSEEVPLIDDALDGDLGGGEAITDLAVIASTSDGSLSGRNVALSGVTAGEVPYDASFWVVSETGEKVWIVLDEVRTPNTPIEGRVDVDQGDIVDIVGVVRNASEGAPPTAAMPGPTQPLPEGIAHFIHASQVTQSGE